MSAIVVTEQIRHIELKNNLVDGWQMARYSGDVPPPSLDLLPFVPATVPGTVASNLAAQNAWSWEHPSRFDAEQWCFRLHFTAEEVLPGEKTFLCLEGIATIASVWLNGTRVLDSESMFARHEIDVSTILDLNNELLIICLPLESALRDRRSRKPSLRWKTQVVAESQLRWFRTTLLGRAPGFAPKPEPVGPWRPVSLVRRRHLSVDHRLRSVTVEENAGHIHLELALRSFSENARPISGQLSAGGLTTFFDIVTEGTSHQAVASLRIPEPALWWPHTHGEQHLYTLDVQFELADGSTILIEEPPAAFRTTNSGMQRGGDASLQIVWNDVAIFCRGVVWTPVDAVSLSQDSPAIRERLLLLRDAGFNLIRIPGTAVYENHLFHSVCDELGLLVWQDMMFANMDYPFGDPEFHAQVVAEAESELARLSRYVSTAVICGNSEIEQQVSMLGLDASIGRGTFFGEELPALVEKHCPGAAYIPSAPYGGDLPFRTNRGVANYFGVGAYMRPLEDARRAEVLFASECLAFANVPEQEVFAALSAASTLR